MSNKLAKTATRQHGLLADKLISAVDKVRRVVHQKLGTRPWTVDIITRRWSGEARGIGTPTTSVLTLDPIPQVVRSTHNRLDPTGQAASGTVQMTGVSLRYAQEELQPKVDQRTEVAYRLTELHGSRQKVTWLVLASDPIPRRGDKSGDATDWQLSLNETTPMGNMDGVDAYGDSGELDVQGTPN